MKGLVLPTASVCLALAIGALTALLLRRLKVGRVVLPGGALRLPLPMRMATPLAVVIEPVVECVLRERWIKGTSRSLEALGLASSLEPVRWKSLCTAEALMFGTVAMCASGGHAGLGVLLAAGGYLHGGLWLRRQREIQQGEIARDLPGWLDLMTVCVEAGATLTAGLRLIIARAPPGPLRDYFERVLREVRGGRPRAQAFSYVAEIYGVESLNTLASALAHAETSGMSLGQMLRTQAGQRTAERFARAEKLAMQAPVKMLGPLIFCIFPCTFIVIGVPIAVRLKEALGA
ncbi:MAG TPA: type II secretion system F family protein [Steroidobacteraceae bacterium]|nr:type II secretion system F family protein [Steroidobacteraceae bacterium]